MGWSLSQQSSLTPSPFTRPSYNICGRSHSHHPRVSLATVVMGPTVPPKPSQTPSSAPRALFSCREAAFPRGPRPGVPRSNGPGRGAPAVAGRVDGCGSGRRGPTGGRVDDVADQVGAGSTWVEGVEPTKHQREAQGRTSVVFASAVGRTWLEQRRRGKSCLGLVEVSGKSCSVLSSFMSLSFL